MIRAEHLGKVYRTGRLEVPALRDATFSVEAGEFVCIVGPSGSGKSTLFYLLGGLTRATSGKVFIGGVDFSTLADAERTRMRRARIGFIFQKFNLLPTLSARGNIEIAYEIAGQKEPMTRPSSNLTGCSTSPAASITVPPSCRVENSNASPSPVPSSPGLPSCLPMSPRATSTQRTPTLCSKCCGDRIRSLSRQYS